jgi:hypothetical protein
MISSARILRTAAKAAVLLGLAGAVVLYTFS